MAAYYRVSAGGVEFLLDTTDDTDTARRAELIRSSDFGPGWAIVCDDPDNPYNRGQEATPEWLGPRLFRVWMDSPFAL